MVENEHGEKIEFTSEGGSLGNISLSQAREMAVRTARASPAGRYGILRRTMVFDVLSDYEDEDTFTIVVSFRSEGDFEGTPGQERFKFRKTGEFEDREVLSSPKRSMRFLLKGLVPAAGVVAVLVAIAVGIFVLVSSGVLTRYRGAGPLDLTGENTSRDSRTSIRTEITNVSRFATGYTLDLQVNTFSLPETNIDVRISTRSQLTTMATIRFTRESQGGLYFGTVIVGAEYIENSSLFWVRENITVEILLDR